MAACRPKLSTRPRVELFLSRFAEGEWLGVVRPWLEEAPGSLRRSLVVAPTLGQTHALKRRCLAEAIPLLGVEFLTPGMARRRRGPREDPPRPLKLLVLRARIEARMAAVPEGDPSRLRWKSLLSDLEAVLEDLDELLRAGFRPRHFGADDLACELDGMIADLERMGYGIGPLEDEKAALGATTPGPASIADRLLVLAGGAESRGEFFGLAALARRCASVTVVVAEPEFAGKGDPSEAWVEMWQALLGTEARVVDTPELAARGSAVADVWSGRGSDASAAEVILGQSRTHEMERVAERLVELLNAGSDNVAVVFPAADAAHEHLVRLLDARGVAFADHLPSPGTAHADLRVQHGLVDFYAGGCRMESLLALWPVLHASGLAAASLADARETCRRLFDATQAHGLDAHLGALEALKSEGSREVLRVSRLLLPPWPASLTPAEALDRFEAARDALAASPPPGWSALREFARRCPSALPSGAILEAIRGFLPTSAPAGGAPRRGAFARVTLTTARRAAGIAWSDVLLVESNHEIWPVRREPSCWLGDEARRSLNQSADSRFSLGLSVADERAATERRLYGAIARDTRGRVLFSASLYDEEDPEARLAPNAWLERVMAAQGHLGSGASDPGEEFGSLAAGVRRPRPSRGLPPADLDDWRGVWGRRREPMAPFDAHFLMHGPDGGPSVLSASQIEDLVRDPAKVWFDAVLRVQRVEWRPFARQRGKLLGTVVHSVLAQALRGTPQGGAFFPMPPRAEAEARLAAALEALRGRWPANRYWDSFQRDVGWASSELLEAVFQFPGARFAAVEADVPDRATVPAGRAGRIPLRGRMDLVLSDRPDWNGATLNIIDYKTGNDERLSARKMASKGASLQLGVYLAAAASLGAKGAVWLLKPDDAPGCVRTDELDLATAALGVIGEHLESGIYGALTPDRGEFTVRFEWPLACAPLSHAVLAAKFEATFADTLKPEEGDDDE